MITADQLVAHAVGDYILQSDWMATEKTKRSLAALCHVLTYGLPFLFLRPSWLALFVIVSTHFVIDRWRLARFVVWVKNFLGPVTMPRPGVLRFSNESWSECKATGYPPDRPAWLAVWLLIIADNIMHVIINGLALKFL
jgi:hypothetical protein